jgi:Fur family ferric uptake transcriptional regulator
MEQTWTLADTILAELADEGIRTTKLRRAILSILDEHKRPFSMLEIEKALKKKKIAAHRISREREVSKLVEWDILQPVYFQDSVPRYELAHHGHHHHVVCTKCGAVADVELTRELHAEEKRVADQTGFKVYAHSLEFFGLCKTCASKS